MNDLFRFERAKSLANVQMFTIDLQIRRLRSKEPEDDKFVFRWWADLQFLILSLTGLKRIAQILKTEQSVSKAIHEFDISLPGLSKMRDIPQHIEEYAIDSPKRHHKDKNRGMLEVGTWSDPVFTWMDEELNIDVARNQSMKLFIAIKNAFDNMKNDLAKNINKE